MSVSDGGRRPSGLRLAMTLGVDIAVGFGVLTLGGYWLDQRRGGGMGWTLAGAAAGFLYGAYEVWKTVRALARNAGGKGGERPDGES
jgi:hypothetical protein